MWEEHFPPGHMARRALELMKCFGTRRGDLYRLGPHMERTYDDGTPYLYVEPEKGSASEFRPAVSAPQDGDDARVDRGAGGAAGEGPTWSG